MIQIIQQRWDSGCALGCTDWPQKVSKVHNTFYKTFSKDHYTVCYIPCTRFYKMLISVHIQKVREAHLEVPFSVLPYEYELTMLKTLRFSHILQYCIKY